MNFVNVQVARTKEKFRSVTDQTSRLRKVKSSATVRSQIVLKNTVNATIAEPSATATANANNAKTLKMWSMEILKK